MKVIQVIPQFGLAGAEIMCENLIYSLKELGNDVIVVSLYDYHSAITERLEKSGFSIKYLDKKKGFDVSIIPKLYHLFKEEKADVIHTHLYVLKYTVPAAILSGIKCQVHTVHNIAEKEVRPKEQKVNSIFYKYCHVIPVALSSKIKTSILNVYPLSSENVPVVFNGIDLRKCYIKTDYKLKEDIFKILHIGRFSEQKNHLGLIKGFYLFHKQYPESQLLLIGDGELLPEVKLLVAEYKLEDSIIFLGLKDNVYQYLHETDVFILPSKYEGMPMTLIEAMGTGLPIIASNVGGIPDLLENNKSALLISCNENEICDALIKFRNNEQLRCEYGLYALKKSKKFSSQKMAEKYLRIYKKVINKKEKQS